MDEAFISRSPKVMGGTPVFTGTRVPVQTLLDYLEGGDTIDDFLVGFPTVSRYCLAHARCPVIAVPPPALARELRHGLLAWAFWRRSLTPEQVLRDKHRPAA